jgi:hypothetical protein
MFWGLLALTVAAVFTGAAAYINWAEQPARLGLDDRALLAEWKPAYKRGLTMQASLAIFGFLLGAAAWAETGRIGFLVGGAVLLANWPWTAVAILPTNRRLMETELEVAGPETRQLIHKWARLHAVRTGLGAAAVVVLLWTLSDRFSPS